MGAAISDLQQVSYSQQFTTQDHHVALDQLMNPVTFVSYKHMAV